jgi:tRNA pseudouridine38-40 synthase
VADSFLPHQVRNTVGCLIKVGSGKIKPETFQELASSRQAGVVGPSAPANGLCLVKVNYTDFPPHSEEVA